MTDKAKKISQEKMIDIKAFENLLTKGLAEGGLDCLHVCIQ